MKVSKGMHIKQNKTKKIKHLEDDITFIFKEEGKENFLLNFYFTCQFGREPMENMAQTFFFKITFKVDQSDFLVPFGPISNSPRLTIGARGDTKPVVFN